MSPLELESRHKSSSDSQNFNFPSDKIRAKIFYNVCEFYYYYAVDKIYETFLVDR